MNANYRNFALWVIIFLLVLALVTLFQSPGQKAPSSEITFSQLLTDVDAGNIRDVTISGPEISGHMKDGRAFQTYAPSDPTLVQTLYKKDVTITAKPPSDGNNWLLTIVSSVLPVLLFLGLWIYMTRQMQGGAGKAMGFGKSKAKLLTEAQGRVTFEDVAGVDEAKEDLQEIVEFLRDPQKFQRLGGRIPRGVLLVGPPGTGKTLTARAVAGEANVPFFTISGSDFVEMFVGVGASRVRDMFEQAKKNSPCIIFIDEIDAVGRHRGAGLGGGNDEREQTLNQLLVEMDGFEQNEGIIIIAATNRPDVLDPALLRPGRFDRQIVISNPDFIGREKILKVHVRKVPLAPDVDLKVVSRGTPGFSGADLMNLVNEAALLAARRGKRVVTRQEFEDARDKIMMGAERRTLIMTEEEKRLTAYHEGGHALVSVSMPASTPIHKATIIPRGRALGMVQSLPERDQISQSYEQLIAMLAMSMGGRVAEELVFGKEKVTSGAAGDIQQVTKIARAMVTRLGFSDKLGTVMYGENQDEVFLGYSLGRQQNISEATAETIDQEVRRLVQEAHDTATRILTERRADLETLAQGLMEFETLTGDEIVGLLQGVRPTRESASDREPPASPRAAVPSTGKPRSLGPEAGRAGAATADVSPVNPHSPFRLGLDDLGCRVVRRRAQSTFRVARLSADSMHSRSNDPALLLPARRGRRARRAPNAAAAGLGHRPWSDIAAARSPPADLNRGGGVRANALDHGSDPVRSLRGQMLLEAEGAKRPHRVDGANLPRRPIGEKGDGDGDQSSNEVRVAIAAIVENHLPGGVKPGFLFEPDLADAASHLVRFVMGLFGQRLQALAELDDIAVTILPIVKRGEIFAYGLEHRHGILALRWTRSIHRICAKIRRVGSSN